MHFFDHNATTPLHPDAKAAWLEAAEALWLNPSSPYRAAARVRVRLEAGREALADRLGLDRPGRVVFNSGASEGNNAVFAFWREAFGPEGRVAVGPTEHPSVTAAAKAFFPGRSVALPLDAHGTVDVAGVAELVRGGQVQGVSVMAANNETGLLNDWKAMAAVCREGGVPLHCDASQWIGKMPMDAGFGCCDFVTACAHKFGGPKGTGFLVVPPGGGGFSSLHGGAQEGGQRAGTEDVPSILAMLAALKAAASLDPAVLAGPRDRFEAALEQAIPGVRVTGAGAPRLWNTLHLILPPPASTRWVRALEKRGFLVSAGSACSTGKAGPSPVLAAMGVPPEAMGRALRISSGLATAAAEWDGLLEALTDVHGAFEAEDPETRGPAGVISI